MDTKMVERKILKFEGGEKMTPEETKEMTLEEKETVLLSLITGLSPEEIEKEKKKEKDFQNVLQIASEFDRDEDDEEVEDGEWA